MSKVFVGNLSSNTTEDTPRAVFEQFGQVLDCIVMKDPITGNSRGFGFVTFSNEAEADAAVSSLNGQEIDGHEITVSKARGREGGGGGGGHF